MRGKKEQPDINKAQPLSASESKIKDLNKKKLNRTKLFGLPLGRLLSNRSFLAQDETSQLGIKQAQEIQAQNEDGLLILLAHLGALDPFGTLAVLEKYLNIEAIFPAAGSWYHFPILKRIFETLNAQLPHKIMAVYRREERDDPNNRNKFLDFSNKTPEEKTLANQDYIQETQKAVKTPGKAVVLAPYGGREPGIAHLRGAVYALLQSECPTILTLTAWNWKAFRYVVYFSEVMNMSAGVTKQEAHDLIYAEFTRMAQLNKITQKELLDMKSGSIPSKVVWRIVAAGFSLYLFFLARKKYLIKHSKN
jgi:hypothetical protein